jgi:1-deoxy-D-xylulose-5-phosphate synthase
VGGVAVFDRAEEDEMVYLERIDAPKDIKKLRVAELERLAREIRDEIYRVTSLNGGHFASNLGSVELTLALHYVFDTPRDEIVWDVGHQGYPHKIITGRRERFDTIRKEGGLSGFLQREESEHDAFGAGHASTSISAALGMAVGKNLKGEPGRAIAVIGDGALTGGMAYEALNNAGSLHLPFIVVLNDNEMSIAPNVGAMSKYLSRMRTDERYSKAKAEFERLMHRLPKGDLFLELSERMRDSFKEFVYHTMIWEELGFTYVGPVDGHNVEELIETFRTVKSIDGPVFVHAVTTKGKGYDFAEDDPFKHHAAKVTSNGPSAPTPPKYQDVFGEYLTQLADEDDGIVAITAAMPDGTGLLPFAKRHPERLFDVGIAEQHAVTFAAGLATQGLRPVVAIYSTFLQRAYDQVIHDVCVQNLPVVFALDRAGLVGDDGRTHHGVFDFSYLRCLPNMVVMAPKDEHELKSMILTAVNYEDGPIALRFPRGSGTGVETSLNPVELPIGRGEIIRNGSDITIVAVGSRVTAAEHAADLLAERGVSARVVNARFVKPLDEDLLLRCARETGAIVTVEENVLHGGFGAAVLELFMREGIQVQVSCLAIPDVFLDHASQESLRAKAGITAQDIVETALELSTARSVRVPVQGD